MRCAMDYCKTGSGVGCGVRSKAILLVLLMLCGLFGGMAGAATGVGTMDLSLETGFTDEDVGDLAPFDFGGMERDLIFFLHSINGSETNKVVVGQSTDKYMDTTLDFNGTSVTKSITTQTSYSWYLVPALAGNVTAHHFDFKVWIWATSTSGTPQGSINVSVSEVNTTASTLVSSKDTGDFFFMRSAELKTVSNDFNYTFRTGSSIAVKMTVTLTAGDSITFAYDTAKANSRLQLRTNDGADLDSVFTTDHANVTTVTFDPLAVNKTVRLKADISDPLGCYDVRWVNVTVKTPLGNIVLDNVTMERVSGTGTDLNCTYSIDWNHSGYPNGRYDYAVWMVDNSGVNYYYHLQNYGWGNHTSEMSGFFTVGEMVFVNVKVLDSKGFPLIGAPLSLEDSGSGGTILVGLTNATGMYNFSCVFKGNYWARVFWQDVVVANVSVSITQNVTVGAPIVIDAKVYYPSFSIIDGKSLGVGGASVFLTYPNGSAAAVPLRTDGTGVINLTQMANGTYGVRVVWMDVVVNETAVAITSNATIMVNVAVFYLDIVVVDSRSAPLSGAQVVLANTTSLVVFDSKITNLSGGYGFRLPGGTYDISVFWQNTLVHLTMGLVLNCNGQLQLSADIYYLVIRVEDPHGEPLESAHVVVTGTEGNVLDTNFTNETGRIDARLPKGFQRVTVYWLGVEVNSSLVNFIGDSEVTVVVTVNRPGFRVLDSDGGPLERARIDIALNGSDEVLASILTDPWGNASSKLPAARYDITILWMDVVVGKERNVLLNSDTQWQVKVAVYNLLVNCVDSRKAPIKDAVITMSLAGDGRAMASFSTDDKGNASVRLPDGSYDMRVVWQGVAIAELLDQRIEISGGYVVQGAVFYLQAKAVDSRDVGLFGALVTASNTAEALKEAVLSDGDGGVEFRLPIGTYDLELSWEGRVVNKTQGLYLAMDIEEVFRCDVHYLDIMPEDSAGIPLEGAAVLITSASAQAIPRTGTTAIAGPVTDLTFRLPGDNYDITVAWMGVLVNVTTGLPLTSDLSLTMTCSVHYLSIIIVDSDGRALQDAKVLLEMTSTDRSYNRITGVTGSSMFRLPDDHYNITVTWKGVVVYEEGGRALASDSTWLLTTTVFYPMFQLSDSREAALAGTHLDIYRADGMLMDSGETTFDGIFPSRLPKGAYTVICSWQGFEVLNSTVQIISNGPLTLVANVFYLDMELFDSHSVPVGEAIIDITPDGGDSPLATVMTDERGKTNVRLPGWVYDVSVTWSGVRVFGVTGLEVRSDLTRSVTVDVFYLTLSLFDDHEVPVEDVLVDVSADGRLIASAVSEPDGSVLFRLPVGTYDGSMTWRNAVVGGMTDIGLTADVGMAVPLKVHYLEVSVMDGAKTGLKGALVTIMGEGTDIVVAAQTQGNGSVVFRLPEGSYTVKVKYSTTYLMSGYSSERTKDVDLTSSREEVVKFPDFPPPTHTTNAFILGLSVLILMVVIVSIAVRLLSSGTKKM